jgi:hypothetical protein
MPHVFAPIDHADLSAVTGGFELKAWFRPGASHSGGQPTARVEMRETGYEKCLGGVTARANWTPQQLKSTCGTPPTEQ